MKSVVWGMAAAAALLLVAGGQASAANELSLAQSNGCLACHSVNNKIVGPAYKAVAKKYRGESGAEAKLVNKIIKGGSGVWGPIPMPAHPNLSKADAKKLVDWILAFK